MNRNSNRRIHPIAEADGLSPKKHRTKAQASQYTTAVIRHYAQGSLNVFRTAEASNAEPSAPPVRTEAILLNISIFSCLIYLCVPDLPFSGTFIFVSKTCKSE